MCDCVILTCYATNRFEGADVDYWANSLTKAPWHTETCRRLTNLWLAYTGLSLSLSGISELDCATTKTDTAERSISIGRQSLQVSVLPYRCSICAPLVTRQMSIKFLQHALQHVSLELDWITELTSAASPTVHISSTCKVGQKLGEILYLLICSFLPCLSWLLRSRVRKSRKDLWITLYFGASKRGTSVLSKYTAKINVIWTQHKNEVFTVEKKRYSALVKQE